MAQKTGTQGLPSLWETMNKSRISVLPGMGSGIGEESTTATKKSPSGPRWVSQCETNEWRTRGTAAGDGDANVLTPTWMREQIVRTTGREKTA